MIYKLYVFTVLYVAALYFLAKLVARILERREKREVKP